MVSKGKKSGKEGPRNKLREAQVKRVGESRRRKTCEKGKGNMGES